MKLVVLSILVLVSIINLYADTDGVHIQLKHAKDVKKETSTIDSVDDLSSMFSKGKTSGLIRMFYVDRAYLGVSGRDEHRNSTAIGGYLKYKTASFSGVSLATAFYTTNDIALFDYTENGGQDGLKDPSLLGTNYENYIVFGEVYLNYNMQGLGTKTVVKLGYQRYDTPMVGSDDVRMVPNTFEAYKFVNKDVNNVTLEVAQIMSIAYGTFSNIFANPSLDGATSGYSSLGANAVGTGKYLNIGDAAVGRNTNGITNLQVKYEVEHFHVDISNDYAWDLYNTLYIDTGTSWDCLLNKNVHLFIKAQVIKQNSVGGQYMQYSPLSTQGNGSVDSLFGAVKIGAKYEGLTAYVAYSQLSANRAGDESYKNAILSQFGGSPAYTQAMVIRNQFIAGTKAYKVGASYSFKNQGTDISTALYYASFDMDVNSGFGDARVATEPGFDIKYYPKAVKKLQLRFRGNFPRKFLSDSTGWDEYRLIANYDF